MSRNGITVIYKTSNEAYDIYEVWGLNTEAEDGQPVYTSRLRNTGEDEESVLNDYTS